MGISKFVAKFFAWFGFTCVVLAVIARGEDAPKSDIIEHPIATPSLNYYGILLLARWNAAPPFRE